MLALIITFQSRSTHIFSLSMARTSRLVIPHLPHHVLQFGNNRQAIFHDDEDFVAFLFWLRMASCQFKVGVHAYVLTGDQWQLLATPSDEQGLGRMMQWIGRYYVPYFNKKYGRSGTLWQGRFKASVIEPKEYFMLCCRYIEMTPVLSGVVAKPGDYAWSSYVHHVGDRQDSLISGHALYWALGNTPFAREVAYKELMAQAVSSKEMSLLEQAVNKGRVLGSEQFKLDLEKQTHRRIRPAKRGRPQRPSRETVEKGG